MYIDFIIKHRRDRSEIGNLFYLTLITTLQILYDSENNIGTYFFSFAIIISTV